jgi:hypothetical protein
MNRMTSDVVSASLRLIQFPAYSLLVVEERLREQQAEGIRMPGGIELDELALRVLIAAATVRRGTAAPGG